MRNLAYSTQSPEKIGANVEEMLRKELAVSTPIPYQVEDANASKTTLGTVLGEGFGLLFGRQEVLLFSPELPDPATPPCSVAGSSKPAGDRLSWRLVALSNPIEQSGGWGSLV
jgi:hypothetical protein